MSALLVKLGESGSEIREMLVQAHGDNAMKNTAVYNLMTRFLREEEASLTKRVQDGQQRAELRNTLQKFVELCVKIVGCQEHSRTSEHRQRNS
jgi:hypothetical protein